MYWLFSNDSVSHATVSSVTNVLALVSAPVVVAVWNALAWWKTNAAGASATRGGVPAVVLGALCFGTLVRWGGRVGAARGGDEQAVGFFEEARLRTATKQGATRLTRAAARARHEPHAARL